MIPHRYLGLSRLRVSELCLGTMHFGWKIDETRSFEILDSFRAAGGNFIQCSSHYPDMALAASPNRSEELVGRWLSSRQIARTDVVFATRLVLGRGESARDTGRMLAEGCRDSLRRLQTPFLDLLVLEWQPSFVPTDQLLPALEELFRNGLIRHVVLANFPTWRVTHMISQSYLRRQPRIEGVQADYSLLQRSAVEPDILAMCSEQQLGLIARAPLTGGSITLRTAPCSAAAGSRVTALRHVADTLEASMTQVALSWVLRNPTVTSALIGVRSSSELNEAIRATSLPLSAEHCELLDHPYAAIAAANSVAMDT